MPLLINRSLLPSLIIIACLAGILFALKHKVYTISKELRMINSRIFQEKQNIHVLAAENAYLTSPKRLKQLVDANLSMTTIKTNNIIDNIKLNTIMNGCKDSKESSDLFNSIGLDGR